MSTRLAGSVGPRRALRAGLSVLLATSVAFGGGTAIASPSEGLIDIPEVCPTGENPTWIYSLDARERALSELDLEGPSTTFGLLADFEGTSIIIRVKDAETGRSLGVIKTNTSNNSTAGEIYAYRLARLLGFSEIVAPVIPVELHADALGKVRDLMNSRRYSDAAKERNRRSVLDDVNRAIAEGGSFTGAFKVWVPSFMFHAGLGNYGSLGRQEITQHLSARSAQPPRKEIRLSQLTRLYSPQGTHRGTADLAQLAVDYSNMLLMDALMGQNDRFAGANVHFRSLTDMREESGSRSGLPIFEMGEVRLLSLDNGASLSSRAGAGIADLQGNNAAATRIERFSRTSVAQLRRLARRIHGVDCEAPAGDEELRSFFAFMGVTDATRRDRAFGYLAPVLRYIDDLERRYGDAIYFDIEETDEGESLDG